MHRQTGGLHRLQCASLNTRRLFGRNVTFGPIPIAWLATQRVIAEYDIMASSIQTALKEQKKALRKTVAATLNALTSSTVEEQCVCQSLATKEKVILTQQPPFFFSEPAGAITERVLSLPAIRECNSISCYLSMESGEVNTFAIVDAIFRSSEHSYLCFWKRYPLWWMVCYI